MSNPGLNRDDLDMDAPKSGVKRLSSMNMLNEMKKAESFASLEKSPSKIEMRRSRMLMSPSRRNLSKSDSLFQSLGDLKDQIDTIQTEFKSANDISPPKTEPEKPPLGRKVSMFRDKFEHEVPLAAVNKQLPKSVEQLATQAIPKKMIQTLTKEDADALASIESLDIDELLSTYDKPEAPAFKRDSVKGKGKEKALEREPTKVAAPPVAPPAPVVAPQIAPIAPVEQPKPVVKQPAADQSLQSTPVSSTVSTPSSAPVPQTTRTSTIKREPTMKQSPSTVSQETRHPRASLTGRPTISGPSPNRAMNSPSVEDTPTSSPEKKKTGIKFFDRIRGVGSTEDADSPKSIISSSSDSSPVKGSLLGKTKRMTTATLADSKKATRSFKDWYATFMQESKLFGDLSRNLRADENTLPELFTLRGMFGLGMDSTIPLLWTARDYEKLKLDAVWNEQKLSPVYERAISPGPKSPDDEDEEINFRILNIFKDTHLDNVFYELNEDGTPSSFVLQAKPFDLVDALIFPLTQEKQYAETFLYSHRFYMPSIKVLDALVQWYFVDVAEDCMPEEEAFLRKNRRAIQARVSNVLLLWIKNVWQDFQDDVKLFCGLMKFVDQISDLSFGDSQKLIQGIREQRLACYTTLYVSPFQKSIMPMTGDSMKPYGLYWNTDELAAQLTLIDFFFFQQIQPGCYISVLNGKMTKKSGSYNVALKTIMEYVSWFRLLSAYCASLVYKEDGIKKKAAAIKRWIKIAKECKRLNNYNTMFAIVNGLKRPAVASLQAAWEQLPSKYFETFAEMEALTAPLDRYSSFWAEWQHSKPPGVPYLGAYMLDLVGMFEESDTFNAVSPTSGLLKEIHEVDDLKDLKFKKNDVNFSKFNNIYGLICDLETFRKVPYPETIMTTFESPAQYGLPLPNQTPAPSPGPAAAAITIDYTGYIVNHIRDWAIVHMLDDQALDKAN